MKNVQFGTFDTKDDRRELVILFQKLGEGLPEDLAREVRAKFLQSLILSSLTGMRTAPMQVNPSQCWPTGAYNLFIQIVGVLGVPIDAAAVKLDRCVKAKEWMGLVDYKGLSFSPLFKTRTR